MSIKLDLEQAEVQLVVNLVASAGGLLTQKIIAQANSQAPPPADPPPADLANNGAARQARG